MSDVKMRKIIIVGAGIAGLSAASHLYRCGYRNVCIFEATNVIGGRISTTCFGNGWVELGAQWIHGEKDNLAYETAARHNLITDKLELFAEVAFKTDDGKQIDKTLGETVFCFLQESLDRSLLEPGSRNFQSMNIDDYLNEEFQRFLSAQKPTPEVQAQMVAIFNWFKFYQSSIEGCDSLSELAPISYLKYKECEGNSLTNFKNGYLSLVKVIAKEIPSTFIHLNKPVVELNSLPDANAVKVICADSTEHHADHVIMTASLGFLKQHARTFFNPPLSPTRLQTIDKIGFGTVNKIFLEFERPFWPPTSSGYALLWKESSSFDDPDHWWAKGIFGFYTVPFASNVLCGWLLGPHARHMETLSDDQVMSTCVHLLRRFTGIAHLPSIKSIRRSKWYSGLYTRGSYSYLTSQLNSNEELAKPICKTVGGTEIPVILFAGEATHPHYYSTVHGAMETGLREASRIIKLDGANSVEKSVISTSHL